MRLCSESSDDWDCERMVRDFPTHIFLAGFAGSGKTTVGKLLARSLGRRFLDLDHLVELSSRSTVSELIQSRGERYFRKVESHSLRVMCRSLKDSAVISLGGGTLMAVTNRRLVARHGITVYLKCSRKELVRRLSMSHDRPLLKRPSRLFDLDTRVKHLLSERKTGYEMCSHKVTVTNLTPPEVARRIRELVG